MTPSHPPLALIPDALLLPLLEEAADALRMLDSVDVPSSLRHVHGFDRRGLLAGPGRRQLLRAIETDESFRARVLERFCERPEVEATIAAWTPDDAVAIVDEAGARRDIPLLASALWAVCPDGAEFGLGVLVACEHARQLAQSDAETARANERRLAEVEEARRRAEAGRLAAVAEASRLADELQKERGARRLREESARGDTEALERERDRLAVELASVASALDEERLRTAREAKRARALEDDARELRRQLDDERARAPAAAPPSAEHARAIAEAAASAERMAASLRALERRTAAAAPRSDRPDRADAPDRPAAPTKRATPTVPAGVTADSRAGIEAMLGTPEVLLVIDGYNVTKRAWPDATAADQRERLGIATTALHRTFGCAVLIVFDGDGSGVPRPPIRRGGIRVLFSDAGVEADEVVVREIADLPKRVPVVVASSDTWVRTHAENEGAAVVGADAFLRVIKPGR